METDWIVHVAEPIKGRRAVKDHKRRKKDEIRRRCLFSRDSSVKRCCCPDATVQYTAVGREGRVAYVE